MPMIIGEKVILKKFKLSDINPNYVSWMNNQSLLKYSNNRFIKHTKKKLLNFYFSMKEKNKIFLKIVSKKDNKYIGTFTCYINPNHNTANLGILIGDKNFSNKGYGLDAWTAVIKYLFSKKKIRKIFAGTLYENKPMLKIFKKSGMKYESKFYRHENFKKKYSDIFFYSIFK
jgi:RimJ/RimL family protein N-acetyltransferase